MKINWTFAINIAAKIFGAMLPILSKEFHDLIEKQVSEWAIKAEETENPWDDMFVAALKEILGIK